MLVIRLQRIGRKNQPYYRIVIQEKDWAPSSKVIENVGTYNPHKDKEGIELKEERIKYWLSQGAQPSATIHNMLVNAKIIDAPKMRVVSTKKKKKGKEGEEVKKEEPKKEEPKKEEPKKEEKAEEKKAEKK